MTEVHPIVSRIANSVNIDISKVNAVLNLSSEGGTVAFIARYRKENTGDLDEVAIRNILIERDRIFDILDRQQTIIKAIEEQNKLSPELKAKILSTFDKLELEDIYTPYKKRRKTKADIARELGLDSFADTILKQRIEDGDPLDIAKTYLDASKKLTDPNEVIDHAINIIVENISYNVELKKLLRKEIFNFGFIYSKKAPRFKEENSKFDNYFDYHEKITNLTTPKNSHRVLAVKRGFSEKALSIGIEYNTEKCIDIIKKEYIKNQKSIFIPIIINAMEIALKSYIAPSVELDIFSELKTIADKAAISVFSKNVESLLMQAPLGGKVVIGVDPGFKTGCKLAVVGKNGEFLDKTTIYPVEPHMKEEEAKNILMDLVNKHIVEAIAIGNGTASRETDAFITKVLKEANLNILVVVVNESGASIYSASDIAREEFPNLDITFRGSVSIARRLQDPLAELVKIDPKSIGVGQYQHDVDQTELKNTLTAVVEDCVNYVGVDLNTASTHLLSYVSGIGPALSKSIVEYRNKNGRFNDRNELLNVSKFGEKAFEQAAGFLRIRDGKNILDNTGVHPERYSVIEKICEKEGFKIEDVVFNKENITKIFNNDGLKEEIGVYTLQDITKELELPGRDPRKEFKKVEFNENIKELKDLKTGMILKGVVTNITNFGVFVDLGVHQDGLVHISEITDKFIKDPREVLSLGEIVEAKVLSCDLDKKQIALSIKQSRIKEEPKPIVFKMDTKKDFKPKDNKSFSPKNNNYKNQNDNRNNYRSDKGSFKREERAPRVNPNSPFASLAALRGKLKK